MNFLNFSPFDGQVQSYTVAADSYIEINLHLTKKIVVMKRVVYNAMVMLGQLGGFVYACKFTLFALTGFFAKYFIKASQTKSMFF